LSADPNPAHDWPAERRRLLELHPRETWVARPSLETTFWLEVHARFRRACADLEHLAGDYRVQRCTARELAVLAAPRLAGLLTDLHGHHQVEDFHYFPAFRSAAPRLAAGIDVLERDHGALQRDVAATRGSLLELRASLEADARDGPASSLAALRYVTAAGRLCDHLRRHLADEEDLVVPLLLEHGRV
jgi:iron-sulfur cluster repair protein YtfE (RIC family)